MLFAVRGSLLCALLASACAAPSAASPTLYSRLGGKPRQDGAYLSLQLTL